MDVDDVLIDTTQLSVPVDDGTGFMDDSDESLAGSIAASFPSITPSIITPGGRPDLRKIPVPPHRMTPLRARWLDICNPIVTHFKLQIRMNTRTNNVEIKATPQTEEFSSLQKAADFVHAFTLGFELEDAMALLRLDDIYVDSFEIDDVKTLRGEHLSRAIGRISGKDGRTKFTIENSTRTRIVLADKRVHIMGSFNNIKVARDAICALILGSPPGKVYAKLRTVSARINERF